MLLRVHLIFSILYMITYRVNGQMLLSAPQQCDQSPGKCPGVMLMDTGLVEASRGKGNLTLTNSESTRCRRECFRQTWCLLAEFNSQTRKCNLYDNPLWKRSRNSFWNTIYYWNCCKLEQLCYPAVGRCPGCWLSSVDTLFRSQITSKLGEFPNTTENDCWNACFNNPLCGSINYNAVSQMCDVNRKWGSDLTVRKLSKYGWNSYEWHCCQNQIQSFPDSKCQYIPSHPTCVMGKWIFNSSLVFLPIDGYVAGVFKTQDPLACLHACQKNALCIKPFYLQEKVNCFLLGSKSNRRRVNKIDTRVPKKLHTSLFQSWRFSCCLKKAGMLQPTTDKSLSPRMNSNRACIRVMNASCVRLYQFDCTLNKTIPSSKTVWIRMAFYRHDDAPINGKNRILVSNDYRKYWLSVSSENCISKAPNYECEAYSGTTSRSSCPAIVKRSEWYAQKARATTKFLKRPKFVVILDTVTPSQPCYTLDHCSDLIRDIQYYHMFRRKWQDIGYNFLIGDDGRIYEGRGWRIVGAHSQTSYNQISIAIIFIGWFENRRPSLLALNAAKELIQCGVSEGHIDSEYTLVAYHDIRPVGRIPGKELYKIISNWPSYINDSKKPPEICTNVILKMSLGISLSVLVIVCVIVCAGLVLNILRTEKHRLFCELVFKIVSNNRGFSIVQMFDTSVNVTVGMQLLNTTNVEICIPRSKFYLLSDTAVNCGCDSLISNLINYSAWLKRRDVCRNLSLSSVLKSCKSSTILLVGNADGLFGHSLVVLLHLTKTPFLRQMVEQVSAGICVCSKTELTIKEISVSVPKINERNTCVMPSINSCDWVKTIAEFRKPFECVHRDNQKVFYEFVV